MANITKNRDERYPKTCLEEIPLIILQYPSNTQRIRSHHSLHFRCQFVTLTEINEIDEINYQEQFENNLNKKIF